MGKLCVLSIGQLNLGFSGGLSIPDMLAGCRG